MPPLPPRPPPSESNRWHPSHRWWRCCQSPGRPTNTTRGDRATRVAALAAIPTIADQDITGSAVPAITRDTGRTTGSAGTPGPGLGPATPEQQEPAIAGITADPASTTGAGRAAIAAIRTIRPGHHRIQAISTGPTGT